MSPAPRLKGTRILAVVAVVGLALTGCAVSGSGTAGDNAVACVPTDIGPGVTDNTIKVGTTMPLSGSGAATGLATRDGQQAYYDMINAEGGVHGR